MRIKLGFVLGAFMVAGMAVGVTPALSAQESGEWICHRTGKGYNIIWVSESAVDRHVGHGDKRTGLPAGPPPPESICAQLP